MPLLWGAYGGLRIPNTDHFFHKITEYRPLKNKNTGTDWYRPIFWKIQITVNIRSSIRCDRGQLANILISYVQIHKIRSPKHFKETNVFTFVEHADSVGFVPRFLKWWVIVFRV